MKDTLSFMTLSEGTSFAPTPEQDELFTSLLLDGMRWMTVGSPATWDWSVLGRDLGTGARPVQFNASSFGALTTYRSAELAAFGEAIDGTKPEMLEGHRAFWTSDYAVIHSVSGSGSGIPWMASVHMHSNRTVSARCVNGQGAMNEHTGDGMVYTYHDGSEYNKAFESWDWRRVPGITADVDSPMLPCSYVSTLRNDSDRMKLTGTVSDGREGISGMKLRTHRVSALKAVAMLTQGVVHLAAGVECDSDAAGEAVEGAATCGEIATTFENSAARGAVMVACGGKVQAVPMGTLRGLYKGCEWVWHNGTGYLLPDDAGGVLITNGIENTTTGGTATGAARREALFSVAVSHGTGGSASDADRPQSSWLVTVPGVVLADMPVRASANNNVTIAANNPGMQAVWDGHRGRLLAAVWVSGAVQQVRNLSSDQGLGVTAIEVDRPCLLMVWQSSSCGSFTLTASDPSNDPRGGALTVQLTGANGASVCSVPPCPCSTEGDVTTVRVTLPGGQFSIEKSCFPVEQC